MSTSIKQLQLFVKSVMGRISIKRLSSGKPQDYLQVRRNPPLSQSQSSNVPNVDTSTENSSRRKFNPWTDGYSGLHEYE